MGKVALEGLEFFAYHGFYDEEQKMGNKYAVDIAVVTDFEEAAEKDVLSETVDYGELYKIVRDEMFKPSRLLENIGKRIIDEVFSKFSSITEIELSISKFNPPIGGVCGRARVTMSASRNDSQYSHELR